MQCAAAQTWLQNKWRLLAGLAWPLEWGPGGGEDVEGKCRADIPLCIGGLSARGRDFADPETP